MGFLFSGGKVLRKGILLAILRSVVIAPLPWLLGTMIDTFVPSSDREGIMVVMVIFTGLLLLHFAFSVGGARLLGVGLSRMIRDVRGEIFRRLQFLSFGYLDSSTSGRLVSKYAFDTMRIQDISIMILNQFLPTLFYGFGVLLIMILLNWRLALVVVLVVPLYHFSKSIFSSPLQERNHAARMAQEKLTGSATEMISALRLVRSLGEEQKAEDRLAVDNTLVTEARIGLINIGSIFGTFLFVTYQLIGLVVVAVGAMMVIEGVVTVGTLFAFVAAMPIIMQPFQMISQFIEQYIAGQESYRSIRELVTCSYVEGWTGKEELNPIRGEISFKKVSFAYPSKPEAVVLQDFDLRIAAGESVALVGQSGSGKSTIANLILGLYSIQSGSIEIDGVPQARLDMRKLRRRCAIVMQDNILLSGSVLENIRFARDDASDEEVIAAAEAANAAEFIRQLPEGFDSLIGERGVSLSGGQRQRLSIARAILRDPQILILDEATSALDNESETLIQEALERLAKGRTVITIAHRLSTIRNADRIVVLGGGRILEQGSFQELAKTRGAFSRLLTSQLELGEKLAMASV